MPVISHPADIHPGQAAVLDCEQEDALTCPTGHVGRIEALHLRHQGPKTLAAGGMDCWGPEAVRPRSARPPGPRIVSRHSPESAPPAGPETANRWEHIHREESQSHLS